MADDDLVVRALGVPGDPVKVSCEGMAAAAAAVEG
jgi:hypothetical protein